MVGSPTILSAPKRVAISALLPYAISLEQFGDQEMVDAVFRLSGTSHRWSLMRVYIEQYSAALFSKPTPPSLNRVTILLSPYAPRDYWNENAISRWAEAVSAVVYSEEVCWSVVDTLLMLASQSDLQPYIPISIWTWLKGAPPLPLGCRRAYLGTTPEVVEQVRTLGALDILTSYFSLLWSEWTTPDNLGFAMMQVSITEDLSGVGMGNHRENLIGRLDRILGELDRGLEHFKQYTSFVSENTIQNRKEKYRTLREVLLEVDRKTTENTAGMSRSVCFDKCADSCGHVENPAPSEPVPGPSTTVVSHPE